jgi:hypothetical protein
MDTVTINLRSSNVASSFEIFDPKTEKIVARGMLAVPRAEHTATLLADGRVLIAGGYQAYRNLTTLEIIDPVTNSTTVLDARLKEGRFGHTSILLQDGRVLIAGGVHWIADDQDGKVQWKLSGVKSVEIFDPKTQTSSLISDQLSTGRGLMVSSLMRDGRVLLVGGNTMGHLLDTQAAYVGADAKSHDDALATASAVIELFDPTNNGIFKVANLNLARSQATAAFLTPSSLLVIGGMGSDISLLSTELLVYKP